MKFNEGVVKMATLKVASCSITRRLISKEILDGSWCSMNPGSTNPLIRYARQLYSISGVRKESGKEGSALLERQRQHEKRKTMVIIGRNSKSILAREISGKNLDFRKENIWTIPNLLCLMRITASPYLGYLVLAEEYLWAFGLVVGAAVTDLLDGVIARRFPSQSSRVGSILDPLADKCLISVLSVTLTAVNLIPFPLTALIIARDLGLIGASFYIRYITVPHPRTWSRFWDVQRSAVEITPSLVSKVNTLLQLTLVGVTVGAPIFHYIDHPLLHMLWYITAGTTIASGLSYCIQMKGFRVLQSKRRN